MRRKTKAQREHERKLAERRERDRIRREKAKRAKAPKRPAKPPTRPSKPTKRERELEKQLRAAKAELEAERKARKAAEQAAVKIETKAERISRLINEATARKARRDRAERVKRFGPIADLAERRMYAFLSQIGDGAEVTSNSDASADGYVIIPWQGNVFDSYLMVSNILENIPADYWVSFVIGFVVPDSQKVKSRLRRSDIEAAPYRRATYPRRGSATHVVSAIRRAEEIERIHKDMGSVAIDLAVSIHWNPDNKQPNRYHEGMDLADTVHRTAKDD